MICRVAIFLLSDRNIVVCNNRCVLAIDLDVDGVGNCLIPKYNTINWSRLIERNGVNIRYRIGMHLGFLWIIRYHLAIYDNPKHKTEYEYDDGCYCKFFHIL